MYFLLSWVVAGVCYVVHTSLTMGDINIDQYWIYTIPLWHPQLSMVLFLMRYVFQNKPLVSFQEFQVQMFVHFELLLRLQGCGNDLHVFRNRMSWTLDAGTETSPWSEVMPSVLDYIFKLKESLSLNVSCQLIKRSHLVWYNWGYTLSSSDSLIKPHYHPALSQISSWLFWLTAFPVMRSRQLGVEEVPSYSLLVPCTRLGLSHLSNVIWGWRQLEEAQCEQLKAGGRWTAEVGTGPC